MFRRKQKKTSAAPDPPSDFFGFSQETFRKLKESLDAWEHATGVVTATTEVSRSTGWHSIMAAVSPDQVPTEVTVEVTLADGSRYSASCVMGIPPRARDNYTPGKRVLVRVSPDNRALISVSPAPPKGPTGEPS
jgi:hypothetical protein